jgi:hypothetical protein
LPQDIHQPGQIAASLGVAGAGQHAAGLRGQRKNMAGLVDVLRPGVGLHRDLDGARAIVRGNAGGDALGRLDRNGEVGVVLRGVVADHGLEAQLARALLGQRDANQPARLAHHEVDVLGAHLFGGHDQVALVLAVFVVEDHHHAASADIVEDFGNGVEAHGFEARK